MSAARFEGRRGRPQLSSASEASRYQREWFAEIRRRGAEGEPVALVNADAPQELFRALDIPYVVNQWWAALCSAKQKAPRYLGRLRELGYPDDQEQYSALPLASALDDDPDPPWGGLPRPTIVLAEVTGDVQRKIFELWSSEIGATFYALERTTPTDIDPRWWERIAERWDEVLQAERIELMVQELEGLIALLETTTGRRLLQRRLAEVMGLSNEQARENLRARELIAGAAQAPVTITDTIPSVMIPQWHRGTEWGRDAARAFRQEVQERVRDGAAACPGEQVRLMWIGTGLWFNLGFYEHFQERYGAVFVWSMYLGIAADAYRREGGEPLRALAARFVAMPDLLHTVPWTSEWYAKEARLHRVDGAVHLTAGSDRGQFFISHALERAGVPVLELDADTVDARVWDEEAATGAVARFLEERVLPVAERRRTAERRGPG
jgi:hypothetical protein